MKRKLARRPEPGTVEMSPELDGAATTEPEGLSRRTVIQRALGLAAVGAVGGTLLGEVNASPALAAGGTVEPGGVAPTVVFLTDGASIAVDASQGNDFRVTINGSRTMDNPTNALDGQKIVLQITQGSGGSYGLTWGSGFEFSTGLPQPTLSTAAGDTDLFAFIYNAAKGKWLMAAFINGFTSVAVAPPPPGTFRLFPSTNGPSTAASYSGPYLAGVLFEVTSGGTLLEGYWWWVCEAGQSTAAQKFALWQLYNTGAGTLVATATTTSTALSPGQWNYVPLTTPVPLAIGATYMVATGLSNGFPVTTDQFGSGEPYAAGIVNGPLTAFSDLSGSNPAPFGLNQCLFSTLAADPSVGMPLESYESSNLWMDLQVTNTAPAETSYRLWPNYPTLPGSFEQDTTGYTLATEFTLAASCTLDKIWFYSPLGVTVLPSRCAIWDVATQSVVAGTDNSAPAWSGPAGSGWVSCPYSAITLPVGDYKVAVFSGGGSPWFQVTPDYWGTGGPGSGGIVNGPMTAPGLAGATNPGQSTYSPGSWAYPLTYGAGGNGENFWVDVEAAPA